MVFLPSKFYATDSAGSRAGKQNPWHKANELSRIFDLLRHGEARFGARSIFAAPVAPLGWKESQD